MLVMLVGSRPDARGQAMVICGAGDATCTATSFPANDDGFTEPIELGFTVTFGGTDYNKVYVDNNGFIRFKSPAPLWWRLKSWESYDIPVIAAFHADVDTRVPGSQVVTHGTMSFDGHAAFHATWDGVGYYDAQYPLFNQFQLILVDRSDVGPGDFDIIFNYQTMVWENTEQMGATMGVGGWFPPRAGYSDGAGGIFDLPGSGELGTTLDISPTGLIYNNINSGTPGRYVRQIRNGGVVPELGGTVFDGTAQPVAGAMVEACPVGPAVTCELGACAVGMSGADGTYQLSRFESQDVAVCTEWTVRAFPPAGTAYGESASSSFLFPDPPIVTGMDLVLVDPMPIPAGTTLEPSNNGDSVPRIYWKSATTLTTQGCAGGSAYYGFWQDGYLLTSGSMTEDPPGSGSYGASVPPLAPAHGTIEVDISVQCPDGNVSSVVFNAYIDPSGFVLSTRGEPLVGAVVTLYRSETFDGGFYQVPDGSAIMAPKNRSNPDVTDERGHFGWDVMSGYYIVRAEMPGCHAPGDASRPYVETDILPVPPEWLDLQLVLDCEGVTPPALEVPEDMQVFATSSSGAVVTFAASAWDGEDGSVPVYCTPASGQVFPPGTTNVTCAASDHHGNVAYADFEVHVVYDASAFLPPLAADGLSVLRRGRTVPVKLAMQGASQGIADAVVELYIAPVVAGVAGPEQPAEAAGQGSTEARFRYDAAEELYVFNLSTRNLPVGMHRLRVELGDGTTRTTLMELTD